MAAVLRVFVAVDDGVPDGDAVVSVPAAAVDVGVVDG
jgi:hypothetical protein